MANVMDIAIKEQDMFERWWSNWILRRTVPHQEASSAIQNECLKGANQSANNSANQETSDEKP
jgi:hypothetical protein